MRYTRHIDIDRDYDYNNIIAYDARLLYVESRFGILTIDGEDYQSAPGTLLCRQPGKQYGYSDPQSFARRFRSELGVSPSELIER